MWVDRSAEVDEDVSFLEILLSCFKRWLWSKSSKNTSPWKCFLGAFLNIHSVY